MTAVTIGEVCTITADDKRYRIINPGGRIGSKVEHGEPYERRLLVDIKQLHPTGTAFDIGAHVGNHSLYLAAVCGLKVHAWECHGPTAERFLDNLELNPGLGITLHTWAAGKERGGAHLTAGRWVEFDPERPDKGQLARGGPIEVDRIDDRLNITDLSVVKVDVEGTEPDVLRGMAGHLERCRPTVYAESHSKRASRRIAEVLEPLGYRMDRPIQMGSLMERWQWAG